MKQLIIKTLIWDDKKAAKQPKQPQEGLSLPVTRQTTSQNGMKLAPTSSTESTVTKTSVNRDGLSSSDAIMEAMTPLNNKSL